MQSKKGQITVFMVIGIVLLIAVFLYFSISGMIEKNKLQAEIEGAGLPTDIRPIKNYIEKCIYEIGVPGIYLLGSQGGYINPPYGETFETDYANMAYGYFNGEERLPTIPDMEEQISGYMADHIMPCVAGVDLFGEMGYEIERETPIVSSIISKEDIIIKVEMPTTIKRREIIWKHEDYVKRIPIRLGYVRDVAQEIVENHKEDTSLIDMEFFGSFDLFTGFAPFDDETTVYTLYDEESAIDGDLFPFLFVIRDHEINSAPVLEPIADMVMAKGVPVVVYVEAYDEQNDPLTFSSDSNMLPIDPESGIINFTPKIKGTFFGTVKVEDPKGLSAEQKVRVVVENKMEGPAYKQPVINTSMDAAFDAYFSMTNDEFILYHYLLNNSEEDLNYEYLRNAALESYLYENMSDDEMQNLTQSSVGTRYIDEEDLDKLPPEFFEEGAEEELPDKYFERDSNESDWLDELLSLPTFEEQMKAEGDSIPDDYYNFVDDLNIGDE